MTNPSTHRLRLRLLLLFVLLHLRRASRNDDRGSVQCGTLKCRATDQAAALDILEWEQAATGPMLLLCSIRDKQGQKDQQLRQLWGGRQNEQSISMCGRYVRNSCSVRAQCVHHMVSAAHRQLPTTLHLSVWTVRFSLTELKPWLYTTTGDLKQVVVCSGFILKKWNISSMQWVECAADEHCSHTMLCAKQMQELRTAKRNGGGSGSNMPQAARPASNQKQRTCKSRGDV